MGEIHMSFEDQVAILKAHVRLSAKGDVDVMIEQ